MQLVDGEVIPLVLMLTSLALIARGSPVTLDIQAYPKLHAWFEARKAQNVSELQKLHQSARVHSRTKERAQKVPLGGVGGYEKRGVTQSVVEQPHEAAQEAFGELMDHVPHERMSDMNSLESAVVVRKSTTINKSLIDMNGFANKDTIESGMKKVGNIKVAPVIPRSVQYDKPIQQTFRSIGYQLTEPHEMDHMQRALNRFQRAIMKHMDHCSSLGESNPIDAFQKERYEKMANAIKGKGVSEWNYKADFRYLDTPAGNVPVKYWQEKARIFRQEITAAVEADNGKHLLTGRVVEITANDLLITVLAYVNRVTKNEFLMEEDGNGRNTISLVSLSIPVYAKEGFCKIINWVHNKTPEYKDFCDAMIDVLLDYIEDMESKLGSIEPHKRIAFAHDRFLEYRDTMQNVGTLEAGARPIDLFDKISGKIQERANEAVRLAGAANGTLCEVFMSVA